VFEIAKTTGGYARTPTTLVSFDGFNGDGHGPKGSLIIDANGNLFGTTSVGGANGAPARASRSPRPTAATPAPPPPSSASAPSPIAPMAIFQRLA